MNTESQTSSDHVLDTLQPLPESRPARQRVVPLVIGDIVVFLVFAIVGIRSHGESIDVPKVLITVAPFIAAWFLVSPFVGAFRSGLETQPGKMVLRTLLAWLAAWPVALLFRGLIEWKVPPLSFALVALLTNTLFLLVWRGPFAFINRKRQQTSL